MTWSAAGTRASYRGAGSEISSLRCKETIRPACTWQIDPGITSAIQGRAPVHRPRVAEVFRPVWLAPRMQILTRRQCV